MKKLLLYLTVAASVLGTQACGEDDPKPTPATETALAVQIHTIGPANGSEKVDVGLASSEANAKALRGDVWTGSTTYAETHPGGVVTPKAFTMPARTKGEKLWLFAKASNTTSSYGVTLAWRKNPVTTYTLSDLSPGGMVVYQVEIGD